jgi:ABC-type uncharacterized transport system substrate-binding protein
LLVAAAVAAPAGAARSDAPVRRRPFRILHVMSYHSPWRWTDGQLEGFREGLGDVPVELRVFQMDTKRNSTPAAMERAGREARALVEQWKPDLVYASDDDAQEYVTRHYLGRELPFVFSGVNEDPAVYGFVGSRNVTGVVEQEHFLESVQLLRRLAPGVRRMAVVFDDAAMWGPVEERMRTAARLLPDLQLGPWDTVRTFDEYQRKMREYGSTVDAVALIGVFAFQDAAGRNVPYQEVLRWTAENSRLPDLSFWIDRVHYGTLCAVTVSEREQGLAAGRIARGILVEGKPPSAFPIQPTGKGLPAINLARSRKLGLMPSTGVLLTAEVITGYDWDAK